MVYPSPLSIWIMSSLLQPLSLSLLALPPSLLGTPPLPPYSVQRRLVAVCRMGRGIKIRMYGSPRLAESVSVTLGMSSAMT